MLKKPGFPSWTVGKPGFFVFVRGGQRDQTERRARPYGWNHVDADDDTSRVPDHAKRGFPRVSMVKGF